MLILEVVIRRESKPGGGNGPNRGKELQLFSGKLLNVSRTLSGLFLKFPPQGGVSDPFSHCKRENPVPP